MLMVITLNRDSMRRATEGHMPSFLERVAEESAKAKENCAKLPYHDQIERFVRNTETISTAAIQEHLGIGRNQQTAREIAPVMRALGYIPLKSRRFLPGGYKGTVTRGWTKPFKVTRESHVPEFQGDAVSR